MTPHLSLPKCVAFDLDGTLVDTGPDLTAATNHALALAGRPPVTVEQIREMVGLGARKLIERGLARTGGGTPEQVEALLPEFLDFYARNVCVDSRPFPGVEAALDRLREQGVVLGICTNKPERMSVALIEALGWTHYFAANLGGDTLPVRKPDAQHLVATIQQMGFEPHEAVMVGDSSVDVAAARAANVPVVAVSFGFSTVPADELEAEALIDHYDQLIDALSRVYSARQSA